MSYFTMMVCRNGHVIEERLEESLGDIDYCEECGAPTIVKCSNCETPIRGEERISGIITLGFEAEAPKYCYKCGEAFPWTQASIEALEALAELDDNLSEEDASNLVESAKEIICETPKTKVAALKFKKILSRAGVETASAVRDLFVDIAAETAKRAIWPN